MYFRTKIIKNTPVVQLVESFRNPEGQPRQRILASLGDASLPEAQKTQILRAIEGHLLGESTLAIDTPLSDDASSWVARILPLLVRSKTTKPASMEKIDGVLLDKIQTENVVVLDAGFASAANIALLKERGYSYLINITRDQRRKYAEEFTQDGFEALPGRNPEMQVEVRRIIDPEDDKSSLILCRSNLKTDHTLDAAQTWSLYMTLLQAEEGFCALKSTLGMRPNFHQLENRVEGHIFISVLAYHLLTWVREKLRDQGDLRDWMTIRHLLSTHMLATTSLALEDGRVLHLRKPTIPDAEQAAVYQRLGIDWKAAFPTQKTWMKSE
jgi:hypothetical protein